MIIKFILFNFGLLIFITLIAALLRFYNLMWGDGLFFHPDERNMAASISQLCLSLARVTPAGLVQPRAAGSCSMNPHFFAYGGFPLYLAYFSHQIMSFFNQFFKAVYFNLFDKWPLVSLTKIAKTSFTDSIFYLRFWSALASTFTVPLVYLITKELFANKKTVPLLAALLTAFTPGLIQAAHFGTTESLLTFFFLLILYFSFKILNSNNQAANSKHAPEVKDAKLKDSKRQNKLKTSKAQSFKSFSPLDLRPVLKLCGFVSLNLKKLFSISDFGFRILTIAMVLGLALATKLTAVYFLIPFLLVLLFKLKPQKIHDNLTSDRLSVINVFLFLVVVSTTFFLASPYNFLNFQEFFRTSAYETKVATGEIKTFYTRQFENTTPLLFQIKHIFPYALGWPIFISGTIGFFLLLKDAAARWRSDPFQGNGKFVSRVFQESKKVWQIFPKRVRQIFNISHRDTRATLETRSRASLAGGERAPRQRNRRRAEWFLLLSFLAYLLPNAFLFAKWTRFMTPVFPFFAIFAAYLWYQVSGVRYQDRQCLHQKTALRRILVHLSSLLKDWTVNLIFLIPYLFNFVKSPNSSKLAIPTPVFIITTLLLFLSILPGLAFFQIYTKPDVRLQASKWIFENIPDGSYLLSETGNVVDIPLRITNYGIVNFDFYHLDENPELVEELVNHLERADYILTPSRRIFANHLRLPEKYPITSNYYQALFDGRLGFELVWVQTYKGSEQPADAEVSPKNRIENLPRKAIQEVKRLVQIFTKRVRSFSKSSTETHERRFLRGYEAAAQAASGYFLSDEAAEETWTVFDHPVVRIFKKVTPHDKLYYQNILKPI